LIVDTTVQGNVVAFPTDAKLMHRARERLSAYINMRPVSLSVKSDVREMP
jgi:IS5 family transposase